MKHLGTTPNNISFVCVLLACSYASLMDDGCKYFNSTSDSYYIILGMYHYTIMLYSFNYAQIIQICFTISIMHKI